jgi:hypothetical protein
MKTLIIAVACLAGGLAMAQDDGEESEEVIEEMQIRLSEMEQIIVTAEKSPAATDEAADSEIDAILADAEALEDDN